MKTTRRRRTRQARRSSSQQRSRPSATKSRDQVLKPEIFVDADTIFGEGERGLGIYKFSGSKSKYGQRKRFGPIRYAMQAILARYHGLPPEHFNASALTDAVRKHLAKNSQYRAAEFRKEMSRQTVLRAVEQLRADNRPPE